MCRGRIPVLGPIGVDSAGRRWKKRIDSDALRGKVHGLALAARIHQIVEQGEGWRQVGLVREWPAVRVRRDGRELGIVLVFQYPTPNRREWPCRIE
jgi:hypothetical protein